MVGQGYAPPAAPQPRTRIGPRPQFMNVNEKASHRTARSVLEKTASRRGDAEELCSFCLTFCRKKKTERRRSKRGGHALGQLLWYDEGRKTTADGKIFALVSSSSNVWLCLPTLSPSPVLSSPAIFLREKKKQESFTCCVSERKIPHHE